MSRGIRIGYKADGTPREYKGPSNLSIYGPARSKKFVSVLAPIGFTFNGSMIWFDPKCEGTPVVAPHRLWNMGHDVSHINPMQKFLNYLEGIPQVGFNPMEELNPDDLTFVEDCDQIAGAIIISNGASDDNTAHFTELALGTYGAVIAGVKLLYAPPEQNLVKVNQIVSGNLSFFDFVERAVGTDDDMLVNRLTPFTNEKWRVGREAMAVLMTMRRHARSLQGRAIEKCLKSSCGFKWADLKKRPTDVFLSIPLKYSEPLERIARLIFTVMLGKLAEPQENAVPVLLIADEMKSTLARLDLMADAMSYSAGVGLQMLPVWQDLNQAVTAWPHGWQTMLGNSGVQMFFRPRENFTADYISKSIGETEVEANSQSVSYSADMNWARMGNQRAPNVTVNRNVVRRSLMLPQEVRALPEDEMLVFAENLDKPIIGHRRPYYEGNEFKGMYSANPYYPQFKVVGPTKDLNLRSVFDYGKSGRDVTGESEGRADRPAPEPEPGSGLFRKIQRAGSRAKQLVRSFVWWRRVGGKTRP